MADKLDTAALHCLQSGQQEAVTQEEGEAEGARLRGEAAKPHLAGGCQHPLQQRGAKPLARMIRAHVEQAEMTVIAQGGKAKGHIVLLDDPAMVLAQLAGKPG